LLFAGCGVEHELTKRNHEEPIAYGEESWHQRTPA
jgi:hypothetical protein